MRLIDKDALLSDIEHSIEESGCVNHEGEIMDCIRYASEVDAVPVVCGEWLDKNEFTCSVCGYQWITSAEYPSAKFCPMCGAKMEDKP